MLQTITFIATILTIIGTIANSKQKNAGSFYLW